MPERPPGPQLPTGVQAVRGKAGKLEEIYIRLLGGPAHLGHSRHTGHSGFAGAIYICTEDIFPSKRLWQLIAQQPRLRTDVPGEVVQSIRFGDQIFIEHAADVVSLSLQSMAKGQDCATWNTQRGDLWPAGR